MHNAAPVKLVGEIERKAVVFDLIILSAHVIYEVALFLLHGIFICHRGFLLGGGSRETWVRRGFIDMAPSLLSEVDIQLLVEVVLIFHRLDAAVLDFYKRVVLYEETADW